MNNDRGPALLRSLLRSTAYRHDTKGIALRETHISWIILTGDYAYKIKKPVNFGFVDFSTLERRRFFCNEELRLNQRFTTDLYLDVVPITGPPNRAHVEHAGVPIEYAVKMRQFPDGHLFDGMVHRGQLRNEHCDHIAERLAAFHIAAERAPADGAWGLPETIRVAVETNFHQLMPAAETRQEHTQLRCLLEWSQHQYSRIAPVLEARRRDGFVRECHGDLHLGNLVLLDERPTPFDCIEFNPQLRWIDVISEVAFLGMDLEVRGEKRMAYRFLNRYETLFGDYAGLCLWDFYRLYRSMVRAKVMRLTLKVAGSPDRMSSLMQNYRRYLDFGTGLLRSRPAALVITHGVSGSGKSHVAGALSEMLPAIWLRSDIERKRLNRLDVAEHSNSGLADGIYSAESTRRTYSRLRDLARTLLQAGLSVIVDAAFLHRWQREQQLDLAKETGATFHLLDLKTPPDVLGHRIAGRSLPGGTDPSEATAEVLQQQLRALEPLTEEERAHRLIVDGQAPDIAGLASDIDPKG